jgi:hypothetical protein
MSRRRMLAVSAVAILMIVAGAYFVIARWMSTEVRNVLETPAATAPVANSDRQRITVDSGRLTFEVPNGWVTYLSPEQLKTVENPDRDEWDTEFARACNAALRFDRCLAHVGSEPWGKESQSFADLQVSVYALPGDPNDLEEGIVKALRVTVKPDELKREMDGAWKRVLVSYERWHFDYGATAVIDVRLRNSSGRNYVFLFMYTKGWKSVEEIPRILGSVRVSGP